MPHPPALGDAEESSRLDLRALARILRLAQAQRRPAVAMVALTIVVGLVGGLEPLVLRHIVDVIDGERASVQLIVGVAGLFAVGLVREVTQAMSTWLGWRTRLKLHHAILETAVDRLHGASLAFHRREPVGALMTRLDRSIQGVVGAFSELVFALIPSLVFLATAAITMVRLEWRLALPVLILVPLPALVGAWAAPRQTARDRALLERWSLIYARFHEVLGAMLTVKSFAMERAEQRRFLGAVEEANGLVVRGVGFDARVSALQSLTAHVGRVVVVGFGAYLALHGRMTVGTLMAFIAFLAGLFGPVQSLTAVYQTVRRAAVSVNALRRILDAEAEIRDLPGARELAHVRGAIELDRVTFGYERGAPPVLDGITLRIEPGTTVALVGPSGGGKTTISLLLQRLYEPTSGTITIDGQDLRSCTQASLRRQLGVVLQEPVLFDDTVAANIAYGRPDASQSDIEAAARAANAHEFIVRLPEGYATKVGERGNRLSTGQRQRIAIARALAKNPAIVILDEATSALDGQSEAEVEEALARLLAGRTTIVIAHRLSTVVRADRIVVLAGGRIAETGRHAELVARGGVYASLVARQMRGWLGATDATPIPDADEPPPTPVAA